MSDKLDWLVLGSWAALMGAQIGLAVYDGWKLWKDWRRSSTDDERDIDDETRHGWRLAIPLQCLYDKYYDSPMMSKIDFRPPFLWTTDHQDELAIPSSSSVVLRFESPAPKGVIYGYRRYSLIQPNANVVLSKIWLRETDEWELMGSSYLTARTLLIAFRWWDDGNWSFQGRVVLMDTFRRESRSFLIEFPHPDVWVTLAYASPASMSVMHIVFTRYIMDRLEFIDAKYEIPTADANSQRGVRPLSWEETSFPIGHRVVSFFKSGVPAIAMAYDPAHLANTDSHRCYIFDHSKRWRVETMTQWLTSFQNTASGARIVNAAKSFSAFSPPGSRIPAVGELYQIFKSPTSDGILGMTLDDTVWHRWLYPPSLKHLAAVALFRENPDLKLSTVSAAIGFDLSDGIPDEDTEESAEVVYV